MALRKLSSFIPIDSKKKATELVHYVKSMDVRERFSLFECIKIINDSSITQHFIDKCGQVGLLSPVEVLRFANDFGLLGDTAPKQNIGNNNKARKTKTIESEIAKIIKSDIANRKKAKQKKSSNSLKDLGRVLGGLTDYTNVIATNVKASEFIVEDGIITYGEYCLKSVRIKKTEHKYLCEITHNFTVRRDLSFNQSKRFAFNPYNDLSFLLAEIDRVKNIQNISTDERFPLTGTFELPWKYVIFNEGIMYLRHPNPSKNSLIDPFNYRHPSILKSFRDILPYIQKVCTPFLVEALDGVVTKIINFEPFYKYIPHFFDRVQLQDKEVEIHESVQMMHGSAVSLSEFKKHSIINKSKYIHYLSTKHVSNRPIFYLLESVSHESSDTSSDEKGYLFTIKEHKNISVLAFENITDESRSTLLFFVRTKFYDDAVKAIRRFLASDFSNKRRELSYGNVKFPESIIEYDRVFHNYFPYWTHYFQRLLMGNTAF